MASVSVAQYGGYPFANNEINLVSVDVQTRYSQRNKAIQKIKTVRCSGELVYTDTASIVAKMQAIEAAFSQDGKNFTYTVNSVTAHSLLNSADCISGVKVIKPPFYPNGNPEQLATTRTIDFTLQATYDAVEDDLVLWEESVATIGTGGPRYFIVEAGDVILEFFTSTKTAQYYQQTGRAVGYINTPTPNGPVNPAGEFGDRRRITPISGKQIGNGIRFPGISWSYYMGRDISEFGPGNFLPTSK